MNTTVLAADTVYGTDDRYVRRDCAGSNANATGYTIHGVRLAKVTKREIKEWADAGLGALTCECGKVTA